MKKKATAILSAIILCLALAGCGQRETASSKKKMNTPRT